MEHTSETAGNKSLGRKLSALDQIWQLGFSSTLHHTLSLMLQNGTKLWAKCNIYHQTAKIPVWIPAAGNGCSSFKISFACVPICAEQFQ